MSQSQSKLAIATEALHRLVHEAAQPEPDHKTVKAMGLLAKEALFEMKAVEAVRTAAPEQVKCSKCGQVAVVDPCTACYVKTTSDWTPGP